MRPKTKKQRQFVEMAGRLPVISEADKAWMMGHFKPQVRLVNLPHTGHAYHCQCCGKVVEYPGRYAEIDKCLRWRCPECGADCEVVVDRGPRTMSRYTNIETEMYFTKVDVFEGVQVFRQIVANRRNVYGCPTEWEFPELWQNWVLADGSEVITSRPYTRGISFFNWYDKGEIGIGMHNHHCSGYYEWRDVYDCYGHFILPKPRFTGLLRRNGYRGWITKARLNVVEAAKGVICDPFAEELAKVGQKALFVEYVKHPHRFRNKEVRAAVRICVRNGYKVRDALLWLDYVDDLVELGKDCRNKVYVCPDNLREAHAWSDRMVRRKREQEEIEERKAEALEYEETYHKRIARYLGIEFGDERVWISVLRTVLDVLEEGTRMHHCVFSHGYWKDKDVVLLSARSVSDGSRVETIEVNLKRFEVVQSRGLQNVMTKDHARIVRLVRENMDAFRKAKRRRKIA